MYNKGNPGWPMKSSPSVLTILLATLLCPLARAQEPSAARAGGPAAIISLDGQIDDYSRSDLIRRFDHAKELGARIVILDIDSPGGLVTASLDISRYLKRQDEIHTIAFVRDKAYSGGAMVAMACNEIWMAPSSTIGDCAPIIFNPVGQLEDMPASERAKAESPIVKDFEDSAKRNGYSPVLAVAMVQVERSVYFLQNDEGEKKIVDEPEYQKLIATGRWKPVPGFDNPIDGPKSLFTVYTDTAIALGLAKGKASSALGLCNSQGYRLVADLRAGYGEKLVELLNNTAVRGILLLVFLQSLYIALHAPGHGAAEAVAVVSLGLLVGIPLLTGYAQWWEVAVIFIGLGLCAFEIFVFPGHMVSLILGTVMVLFGLIMTFSGKEPTGIPGWLPGLQATWHGIQNGLLAVVSAIFGWFLLSLWLRRYLPTIPYFNKLILTATSGATASPATQPHKAPDVWPFVGSVGVTATDLRPGGSVEFPYGDATRASAVVSLSGYISKGTKVIVEQIDGSSVRVRAISSER